MPESTQRVGVVVPARDEHELIGDCLRSIEAAALRVDVPVTIVVVVDGGTDRTADVARTHRTVVLDVPGRGVGAARALGAARILDGDVAPARTWLACTDADSQVPLDWLQVHLAFADAGADAVVGTICLSTADEQRNEHWAATYRGALTAAEHHTHVHGANLGVRGSSYLEVGGFASLGRDEDVDLVTRLERHGAHLVRALAAPVTTSARVDGRVAGGVADDLRSAADQPATAARGTVDA